jgi:hypothetical protein
MSNSNRHFVKYETVMRSADFMQGYKDKLAGKPFDYERRNRDLWSYERGRLFACYFSGAIKNGRKVRFDAVHAFKNALRERYII